MRSQPRRVRFALRRAVLCCAVAACGGAIDTRSDEGSPGGPASFAAPGAQGGPPSSRPGVGGAEPATEPAGVGDGTCTPGDVTRGLYDPDCVYVLGTTVPGMVRKEALFHPDAPTRLASGWGVPLFRPVVRGDRRILFTSMEPAGVFAYAPKDQSPYANTRLDAPACEGSVSIDLVLHPRSGTSGPAGYYGCLQGSRRTYYELGTSNILDVGDGRLLGLDEAGIALVQSTSGALVLREAGTERRLTGLDGVTPVAVRARPGGGFRLAATPAIGRRVPHLHELDVASAEAVDAGAYLMGSIELKSETALEPSGALDAVVTLWPPFGDGVVRLRIGRSPEVLFDETKNAVQLHGAKLVTGP